MNFFIFHFHKGGLIEIQQNWKCNFDYATEKKECFPTFTFNLLQSGSDQLSPGINYRYDNTKVFFDILRFVLFSVDLRRNTM